MNEVVIRTVAASDARMGGAPLPAMTNSGSGNQGISATEPVVVVADYVKANDEDRLRAMVLSHMMAIYTHSFLPKLSALCATLTASMGSASGMAWLLDREHAEQTGRHGRIVGIPLRHAGPRQHPRRRRRRPCSPRRRRMRPQRRLPGLPGHEGDGRRNPQHHAPQKQRLLIWQSN